MNIDGDGQGDLAGHGGEIRAVLVYQIESYRHWQEVFERDDLEHGAFGENFTVEGGLSDDEVCIGDRYRIGETEFEGTQPRVTCFRVGMRVGEPQLPSLLVAHHRPGFYLRVLNEGHVSAGEEIVRMARGPHALSVAAVDALLYLPGHDPERLKAALDLDLPALSPGWRGSFRRMLESEAGPAQPAGVAIAPPPAWAGFRTLTVTDVVAESAWVTSFRFVGDDALPVYQPGQFLTLKVAGAGDPVPVRTYSLSGDPDGGEYRISVKRESHGRVSRYLDKHLRPGDRIEVAAARGEFVLGGGTEPVLLISAGIGLTRVLAMLHRLASEGSTREVWWIHTTHDADSHAFAAEVTDLLGRLASAHSLVYYTTPRHPLAPDLGVRAGRLTADVVAGLGLPADANAYLCGPEPFMDDVAAALTGVGIGPARIHTERFGSRSDQSRRRRCGRAPATPATRPFWRRSGGDLRPLGAHHGMVGHLLLCARARRGVRRAHPVVVPHRRVSLLRHGGPVGRGVIRDPAPRDARRGRAAHLLGAADRGPRDRPLRLVGAVHA